MKKTIISERERGLLFKNGRLVKMLFAGKYVTSDSTVIEKFDIDKRIEPENCILSDMLADKTVSDNMVTAQVPERHIALHYTDGIFREVLEEGKYAYWKSNISHEFRTYDISGIEVDKEIPQSILQKLEDKHIRSFSIAEYQKAALIIDNKIDRVLTPGTYYFWNNGISIVTEVFDMRNPKVHITVRDKKTEPENCILSDLLASEKVQEYVIIEDVPEGHIALHYTDGICSEVLEEGRHAYWKTNITHEFRTYDISKLEVDKEIPRNIIQKLVGKYIRSYHIAEYQNALLLIDNKTDRILLPGTYYFWNNAINIVVEEFDMRNTLLGVQGQEILTLDKVGLRINFVCHYNLTDIEKIYTEIGEWEEQIHIAVQMALREYVGKYKLDDILANKDEMSAFVEERLKAKCKEMYIEITDAGVKDIILPGEIRSIMNTVLIAEKQAQANVIKRREEVASTRSLLNTAKLLEENEILYKLKQMEYIENICRNVGNINVGNGNLIEKLTDMFSAD